MGKKQKEGSEAVPTNINGVPNRDIMQRMNFLWQASVYLEQVGGGGAGSRRGLICKASDSGGGNMAKEEEKVDIKVEEEEEAVPESVERRGRVKKEKRTASMLDLARIYVRTMKTVGQKTTVKMDPGVKRTLCRRCSVVLVPGISARIRIRPSKEHSHWAVYTCLECRTSRRIPAPGVSTEEGSDSDLSSSKKKKRRPLFAARAGHVVLRGKEVVESDD